MPDLWDSPDGRTYAMPRCASHPALVSWPAKNLINGSCPSCGALVLDGAKAARVLRARRLVRAL